MGSPFVGFMIVGCLNIRIDDSDNADNGTGIVGNSWIRLRYLQIILPSHGEVIGSFIQKV